MYMKGVSTKRRHGEQEHLSNWFMQIYADQLKHPLSVTKKYFMLFFDDFNRMICVYILEKKSDAFTSFMNFKALVESIVDA